MSTTKTSISSPIPQTQAPKQATEATSTLLPKATRYIEKGSIPNTPLSASLITSALTAVSMLSISYALIPLWRSLGSEGWSWARPQLGIYGFAWGLFHLCEFWTTAGWNVQKLSVDAFLLNNTTAYHLAHLTGLAEYFITSYFFPQKFNSVFCSPPFFLVFAVMILASQALRSLAMIHAAQSFSHIVKDVKLDDHTLITNGVYSWSRHPSYAGFFYWAVATQLLLGNVAATVGFVFILARWFSARIIGEEKHLVRFFGDAYIQYRKRVGTGLPFLIPTA